MVSCISKNTAIDSFYQTSEPFLDTLPITSQSISDTRGIASPLLASEKYDTPEDILRRRYVYLPSTPHGLHESKTSIEKMSPAKKYLYEGQNSDGVCEKSESETNESHSVAQQMPANLRDIHWINHDESGCYVPQKVWADGQSLVSKRIAESAEEMVKGLERRDTGQLPMGEVLNVGSAGTFQTIEKKPIGVAICYEGRQEESNAHGELVFPRVVERSVEISAPPKDFVASTSARSAYAQYTDSLEAREWMSQGEAVPGTCCDEQVWKPLEPNEARKQSKSVGGDNTEGMGDAYAQNGLLSAHYLGAGHLPRRQLKDGAISDPIVGECSERELDASLEKTVVQFQPSISTSQDHATSSFPFTLEHIQLQHVRQSMSQADAPSTAAERTGQWRASASPSSVPASTPIMAALKSTVSPEDGPATNRGRASGEPATGSPGEEQPAPHAPDGLIRPRCSPEDEQWRGELWGDRRGIGLAASHPSETESKLKDKHNSDADSQHGLPPASQQGAGPVRVRHWTEDPILEQLVGEAGRGAGSPDTALRLAVDNRPSRGSSPSPVDAGPPGHRPLQGEDNAATPRSCAHGDKGRITAGMAGDAMAGSGSKKGSNGGIAGAAQAGSGERDQDADGLRHPRQAAAAAQVQSSRAAELPLGVDADTPDSRRQPPCALDKTAWVEPREWASAGGEAATGPSTWSRPEALEAANQAAARPQTHVPSHDSATDGTNSIDDGWHVDQGPYDAELDMLSPTQQQAACMECLGCVLEGLESFIQVAQSSQNTFLAVHILS